MYPATRGARDRFVLERRVPRPAHNPWHYQDLVVEDERTSRGAVTRTATVFLTGHECAWRCVMCDLWQYTTVGATPEGAIPTQIAAARQELNQRHETVSTLKLYNASNFFDAHAVPDTDYPAIADQVRGLSRVVVESHPALVGPQVDRLRGLLDRTKNMPELEVAMGLETVHPDALDRLNKGITVEQFVAAATDLRRRDIAVRVFLLIAPPFIRSDEQDRWLVASTEAAESCGASVISLIPTRGGNGAMETLAAQGLYAAPDLDDVERSFELALKVRARARVFVDLWDIRRFAACPHCLVARTERLRAMNLEQQHLPAVKCPHHEHGLAAQ